ncbi:major facilitator superfamily protein, putative [Ichthyophthirius multifiliis]|uniref:Major facilitator superfamily protein, putative n=1 Tax=Ichthyophthirius multifiliis TaxID=5932 RepID=G0R082_ICHMU|nr:major facilitator superfamily protein, putative [Ichthyophthirius multifiliis]EGR29142.1 major facilitator superfamily protein, putative [Ichthyophthirius multifiliis]|eukprot:XP_004030378.1 major facilitator superfamily protein, putative [Ichthyophthirius multifiliis]
MILSQTQKGSLTILGGFLTHLVCGAIFNWGTLNIYMTSYFRTQGDQDLQISTGVAIYPIMMIFVATGMPLGIQGIRLFGSARKYLYFASLLTMFFQFISSYTTHFWQYVLAYGVGFGVSTGSIYFVPLYMGYLYFPKRKGMVAGIILCGYGLSALIFGFIFFQLVNPNNKDPEKDSIDGQFYFQGKSVDVALNVPSSIRYCCIIQVFLLLLGSSLVCYHPEQIGEQEKRVYIMPNSFIKTQKIKKNFQPAPNVKTALCSKHFFYLILIGVLGTGFGILVNSNYKTIGKKVIVDDKFMTMVGSFSSLANGLSRLFWSSLIDKYSFKQLITSIFILQIFLALTMQLSFYHKIYYLFQVYLIVSNMGGTLTLYPPFSAQIFGVQVGSKIFGLYWYGFGFANFVQFLIVREFEKKIGFINIFYIYAGITFLALVVLFIADFKPDWSKYYKENNQNVKKQQQNMRIQKN